MASIVNKSARLDQVAEAALGLFVERPREEVTFEAIAERAGLSYWQVYRFHGNATNLFRAVVDRLISGIEWALRAAPVEGPSVSEAVKQYVSFAAELMQDEAYRHLLYLIIRDGCAEPILKDEYEARVARRLRSGLERVIGNAGRKHNMLIVLGGSGAREFVRSLEAELVLPKLLPGYEPPSDEVVASAIKSIVGRLVGATHVLGSQAA